MVVVGFDIGLDSLAVTLAAEGLQGQIIMGELRAPKTEDGADRTNPTSPLSFFRCRVSHLPHHHPSFTALLLPHHPIGVRLRSDRGVRGFLRRSAFRESVSAPPFHPSVQTSELRADAVDALIAKQGAVIVFLLSRYYLRAQMIKLFVSRFQFGLGETGRETRADSLSRFFFRVGSLSRSPSMARVVHAIERKPSLLFLIRLAPYPYSQSRIFEPRVTLSLISVSFPV